MKGQQAILDLLNRLLANELSAMDQYFVHACMYQDWGLDALHQRIEHESLDERQHASKLIERILFIEGKPNVAARNGLAIGADCQQMLANDLAYECQVATDLRAGIQLCEQLQDYPTRELLVWLLEETEADHMHWLEQQLGLIAKVGLENYLQSQIRSAT